VCVCVCVWPRRLLPAFRANSLLPTTLAVAVFLVMRIFAGLSQNSRFDTNNEIIIFWVQGLRY
jgi:hypothetical protein